MQDLISHIKKRLKHNQDVLARIKDKHRECGGPEKHNYHGGWSLGYAEGKVTVLEDILDLFENQQ